MVASREKQAAARYPLHTLSGIISFAYPGASPALMGACAQRGVSLAFCTSRGQFLARVCGETLTERTAAPHPVPNGGRSCAKLPRARSMIFGKLYNARWSVERTRRDHGLRIDGAQLGATSARIKRCCPGGGRNLSGCLRGLEGMRPRPISAFWTR
ncbi:MAG: CRISPR-associated endonuclease Cas1 [Oscillospiraceae bacterium]